MHFSAETPVIGVVIAYILNILMSFYEGFYFTRVKIRDQRAKRRMYGFAMLTFVLIVAIICRLLFELVSCIKLLVSLLPVKLKSC